MRRKVILHGPSTLTVSLPATWVKEKNINKGDELEVDISNAGLRVSCVEDVSNKSLSIDISNLTKVSRRYITAAYRDGWDEIHVKYAKENDLVNIQDVLATEVTGFEIIMQGKLNCVIRDLSGISSKEFENAVRRAWLLTIELAKSSYEGILNKDVALLESMNYRDRSINKFTNHCIRFLNKKGVDSGKNAQYYLLLRHLEVIADQFQYLSSNFLNMNLKFNEEISINFKKILEFLTTFYELFYKPNDLGIEKFLNDLSALKKEIIYMFNKSKCNVFSHHFLNVIALIETSISTLVELNLE